MAVWGPVWKRMGKKTYKSIWKEKYKKMLEKVWKENNCKMGIHPLLHLLREKGPVFAGGIVVEKGDAHLGEIPEGTEEFR